ncbi:MAG: hypothetical protein HYX68_18840 [Planctomycetes bacterium]|jgi:inorganic pyrophosphatase|nr:hypothetical protein [Planctomycetota bacterium]
MKGVKYVLDDRGEVDAVIIDVKKHRKLWEDIKDILVARERRKETPVPFEEVKKRLREKGKLP